MNLKTNTHITNEWIDGGDASLSLNEYQSWKLRLLPMEKNVSIQSSGLIHQMKEMYRAPDTSCVRNESIISDTHFIKEWIKEEINSSFIFYILKNLIIAIIFPTGYTKEKYKLFIDKLLGKISLIKTNYRIKYCEK